MAEVSNTSESGIDEDHHGDEDNHDADLLTSLSTWNTWVCSVIIVVAFLGCVTLNTFIIFSLRTKRRASSSNLIQFVAAIISVCLYGILLPLTLAGVVDTSDIISETYCTIQETLTFCAVLSGFFIASCVCVNRMIIVVTNNKNWCTMWRMGLIVIALVILLLLVTVLPSYTLADESSGEEQHGCHLWSSRVDTSMWVRIYVIVSFLILCVLIIFLSFAKIYHHVLKSTKKLEAHQQQPTSITPIKVMGSSGTGSASIDPTSLTCCENDQSQSAISNASPAAAVDRPTTRPQKAVNEEASTKQLLTVSTVSSGRVQPHAVDAESQDSVKTISDGASMRTTRAKTASKSSALKTKSQSKLSAHKRVASIALILVGFYVIFWLPWVFITWLTTTHDRFIDAAEVRIITMVLGYIPSVLDPLMYILMSPLLKNSFVRSIKCARLNRVYDDRSSLH